MKAIHAHAVTGRAESRPVNSLIPRAPHTIGRFASLCLGYGSLLRRDEWETGVLRNTKLSTLLPSLNNTIDERELYGQSDFEHKNVAKKTYPQNYESSTKKSIWLKHASPGADRPGRCKSTWRTFLLFYILVKIHSSTGRYEVYLFMWCNTYNVKKISIIISLKSLLLQHRTLDGSLLFRVKQFTFTFQLFQWTYIIGYYKLVWIRIKALAYAYNLALFKYC